MRYLYSGDVSISPPRCGPRSTRTCRTSGTSRRTGSRTSATRAASGWRRHRRSWNGEWRSMRRPYHGPALGVVADPAPRAGVDTAQSVIATTISAATCRVVLGQRQIGGHAAAFGGGADPPEHERRHCRAGDAGGGAVGERPFDHGVELAAVERCLLGDRHDDEHSGVLARCDRARPRPLPHSRLGGAPAGRTSACRTRASRRGASRAPVHRRSRGTPASAAGRGTPWRRR